MYTSICPYQLLFCFQLKAYIVFDVYATWLKIVVKEKVHLDFGDLLSKRNNNNMVLMRKLWLRGGARPRVDSWQWQRRSSQERSKEWDYQPTPQSVRTLLSWYKAIPTEAKQLREECIKSLSLSLSLPPSLSLQQLLCQEVLTAWLLHYWPGRCSREWLVSLWTTGDSCMHP